VASQNNKAIQKENSVKAAEINAINKFKLDNPVESGRNYNLPTGTSGTSGANGSVTGTPVSTGSSGTSTTSGTSGT
jgi:hypothetical protein